MTIRTVQARPHAAIAALPKIQLACHMAVSQDGLPNIERSTRPQIMCAAVM